MRKQILLFCILVLCFNTLTAQLYRRDITPGEHSLVDTGYLRLFTINDTLKYFEFYTPYLMNDDIECGILSKVFDDVYRLKYASGNNFVKFDLLIKDTTLKVTYLGGRGGKAYSLDGTFILRDSIAKQNAHTFPLNYREFYKAIKDVTLKTYEYPNCNAKFKLVHFKQGDKIEQRWGVGVYPDNKSIDPIENKSWRVCIYNDAKHDWFLLADIYNFFELVRNKK